MEEFLLVAAPKDYPSVLLSGLPAGWFHTGNKAIRETTKRDVLSAGVAVLQESCYDKDTKRAILKTSTTPGQVIGCTFPDVKATVIYKESSTLTLVVENPLYIELLLKTAAQYGVKVGQQSEKDFIIVGNLDTLVDFRKAFDEEIITYGAPPNDGAVLSEPTASPPTTTASGYVGTPPNSPVEHQAASNDGDIHEFFPASLYDAHPNLLPEALAILKKIPAGQISGIHYAPEVGTVFIDKEISGRDDKISKFQKQYTDIVSTKNRLKVEYVDVPKELSDKVLEDMVDEFNKKYSSVLFSVKKELETRQVKIVSVSSRQFDQAKKLLSERLSILDSYTVPLPGGSVLTLKNENIVTERVDVIVNAANARLQHAGGVALAIDRASGGAVQEFCNDLMRRRRSGEVKVGEVVSTRAGGALKCRSVIHAVGPTKSHHDCEGIMKKLTLNVLREAHNLRAKSIAIPAISSGIFGVDKDLVAKCILETLFNYKCPQNSPPISDIRVVIIDLPTYHCFVNYLTQTKRITPAKKVCSVGRAAIPPEKLAIEDGVAASAGEDKTAIESIDESSEYGKSECGKIAQLLSPIAYKWKVLAKLLKLQESDISKMAKGSSDNKKLERVIRKWWKAEASQQNTQSRLEFLFAALKDQLLDAKHLAEEVWKAFPLYPELSGEGAGDEKASDRADSPSTPYTTPSEMPALTSPTATTDTGPITATAALTTVVTTLSLYSQSNSATTVTGGGGAGDHVTHGGGAGDHVTHGGGAGDHVTHGGGAGDHVTHGGGAGSGNSDVTPIPPGFPKGAGDPARTEGNPQGGSHEHSYAAAAATSSATGGAWSDGVGVTPPSTQTSKHADIPHHMKGSSQPLSPGHPLVLSQPPTTGAMGPAHLQQNKCPICLDHFDNPVRVHCGHDFCRRCISRALKSSPYCPICKIALQPVWGNQPKGGTMNVTVGRYSLPGYQGSKTLEIQYYIPDGIQGPSHPNPGKPYQGTTRRAYLPETHEGVMILNLLRKAFDAGLIFTVGTSHTTGQSDVVVWNDIHHKTYSSHGGDYGYPDPGYLSRVKQDLAAKGIVP